MNVFEWLYVLVGLVGLVICGLFSVFFVYVLSVVLSVYYNLNYVFMIKEIVKYCYFLIGFLLIVFIFNILQYFFWDMVGENLIKRVREKMLVVVMKNEMVWFDQEENESVWIVIRFVFDVNNVRFVIGDRIFVIMQNFVFMFVVCIAGFVLQWRFVFVFIVVFFVVVVVIVLQVCFFKLIFL